MATERMTESMTVQWRVHEAEGNKANGVGRGWEGETREQVSSTLYILRRPTSRTDPTSSRISTGSQCPRRSDSQREEGFKFDSPVRRLCDLVGYAPLG